MIRKRKIGSGITSASFTENVMMLFAQALYIGVFWAILKIV